ncbi:uncharacterized protein JCM6883_007152 [Sporobolomyces salmoneus]|uniref:uncharacterized protein n=1 Tax=Sporobolomyces salmoneus TaxID=183962 RepID=UPI003178F69B
MPSSKFLVFASAVTLLSNRVLAAAPTISSPNVYECTPTTSYQITCDDVPCQVVARPSNDPSQNLAVIGTVNTQGASTLPWKASVSAGTSITVYITDNSGLTGNNSPTVIAAGSGDCAGNSASSSSSSDSPAPSSTSSSESSTPSETPSTESSSSSSAPSSSSSASSASSTSVTSTTRSNTATGTSPTDSATPTDAGSGASNVVVGGLFAGVLAVAAALA